MPKRRSPSSTKVSPLVSSESETPSTKQRKSCSVTRKHKHPLASFVFVDDVPITSFESPIPSTKYFSSPERRMEVEKMERRIVDHCRDYNIPHYGTAYERTAIGACEEANFDTYMSATMPAHLYKRKEEYSPHIGRDGMQSITNIIYEFTYPNFPSFGNSSWMKYETTINQSATATSLKKLGAVIPPYFINAPCRCIAKKLFVVLDTCHEIYYIHLTHWVQRKVHSVDSNSSVDYAWVDVF